jgi:hypothetical protein
MRNVLPSSRDRSDFHMKMEAAGSPKRWYHLFDYTVSQHRRHNPNVLHSGARICCSGYLSTIFKLVVLKGTRFIGKNVEGGVTGRKAEVLDEKCDT